MDTELLELMKRISQLRDDELWTMVHVNSAQYRLEALTYARAEISRRGISPDQIAPIRTPIPFKSITTLRNRLVSSIRARTFLIGCLSGSFIFAWANYHSYAHMYKVGLDDFFVYCGFPFDLYRGGGFGGESNVLWPGLVADAAIAALAGLCVGCLFKLLFAQRRNGKHHLTG
jgi:hypothetical protein